MNVYFVYKVLTNRIRALIIAAGYIEGALEYCIVFDFSPARIGVRNVSG